jgi:radical SAM protein with 4Fe4S-binding SPASM domain
MLTEATAKNLVRKAAYADHLQLLSDGTPLFSWLDLSITELCNRSHGHPRACTFCPRIDPGFYPNQHLHMSLELAERMAAELHALEYAGAVVLCGFGEPLLHPRLTEFIAPFKGLRVEIVTNGDRLTPATISDLYAAGASYLAVSCYDGPHQLDKFRAMFDEAGRTENDYILRDRWYDCGEDFGLKLTNRAGTVVAGFQKPVDVHAKCFYPSYSMAVDWNGDVLLCVQDWNKRLRFGSLATSTLVDCWKASALHKRRLRLIRGDRSAVPCNSCNAEGVCHGAAHAKVWAGELDI